MHTKPNGDTDCFHGKYLKPQEYLKKENLKRDFRIRVTSVRVSVKAFECSFNCAFRNIVNNDRMPC